MWHLRPAVPRRRARRPGRRARDERDARPSRARQRGRVRGGVRRARRAPPVDHRPGGIGPARRQRGRAHPGRAERRDLQLPPPARAAGALRPQVPDERGHRGAGAPLRGARAGLRRGPARHVRDRAVGQARAAAGAGARPLRDQAALLPHRGPHAVVRLGAEGAAAPARDVARHRHGRARGIPRLQLDPRAADDLPRGPQAAAGPPPDRRARRGAAAPLRAPAPGRRRPGASRERAGAGARAARAPARLRARAPRGGRPGRRDAVGRHRLLGAGRARGARELVPREHVLDRVRGALLQRAGAGAQGGRPVRNRPPRADPAPRRRRAAPAPRGGVRRAVRGLVRAAHVPRLAAGRGHGQGGAVRRGRRRAVRRLLHVCGRHARTAHRAAGLRAAPTGGAAPELVLEGQPRLQGQAVRARGAPAAARAPPRLEGDLHARCARRAARRAPRRGRPARHLPRPLRGDRGRRRAGPPAGRRHRDLPRRRPAGEDRPRQHGPLPRGARPVLRPRGGRAGAGAAALDEGAATREEAAAARRRRGPAPARDRARPQAGVLDPGGRLAARRPAAIRPRRAVTGPPARTRFFPARHCDGVARPPHRGEGGPQPPNLGPPNVLPLARPIRRAGNIRPHYELRNSELRNSEPCLQY